MKNREKDISKYKSIIIFIISIISLIFICKWGMNSGGIHANNWIGYTWHSFIALSIGGIMYAMCNLPVNENYVIVRVLKWIEKHEYSIYLWHLVIIVNLGNKSSLIQIICQKSQVLGYGVLMIIVVLWGYIIDSIFEWKNFLPKKV